MPLRPYLQLVRLPNVFTAAADSLAGWLLVRGSFAEPGRWLPLLGTSMAVYAAGIALNDFFDYEIDLEERPDRPLPSGRVSRRFAAILGSALLLVGLGLSVLSGPRAGGIAGILIGCVLAYDAGLKRTWLGPELMGACRGLNVLLGLSGAEDFGGPSAWLVAVSMGLFVTGLTWISRSETQHGRISEAAAGMVIEDLALVGLAVAALRARHLPAADSSRHVIPLEGLLVLGLVALVVNLVVGRAVREPSPATLQSAVKTSVFSLIWLNVAIVAAVRQPVQALAVAALWVPAYILGKWLYST